MNLHLSEAEVQQILRLAQAGRTVTQMQRLCGRPPHVIRAVLAGQRGAVSVDK